jgi:hypothetical protein
VSSETVVKPSYFKLGQVQFSIKNCNDEFAGKLAQLLPSIAPPADEADAPKQLNMGCVADVRELVNYILKRHKKTLWVDAACTVSPNGKSFLLSGKSGAGKSTTTLALALGYQWKALSEDITLLNPETDEIISFGTPFSLKAGTVELVENAVGVTPAPILLGEWVPMKEHNLSHDVALPFDFAIHLELDDKSAPLEIRKVSQSEYMRKILPWSNMLRSDAGPEKFLEYLSHDQCYVISGGTLSDRIAKLRALAGDSAISASAGSGDHKPKRDDKLESKLLPDGHLVIFSSKTNWAQTLTPVAALVWEFCDGTNTLEQILEHIEELTAQPTSDELRTQVSELIDEFVEIGLAE